MIKSFFFSILSWYPVFPAALLCFLPMKNQLRRGISFTVRSSFILILAIMIAVSFLESHYHSNYNAFTPVLLVSCLLCYFLNVKAHISKSLSIFVLVCALMGFLANFSNAFDATIHPTSGINNFSIEAAVFQALITTVFAAIMFKPMSEYGSLLIDSFHIHSVWYISSVISLIFLIYNLITVPYHYETLHVNNVFYFYWISMPLLFTLLLLLCVLFYFIVSGMIEASKTEREKHFLEMQESQFRKQQQYLEATAKERHDFKHAVRTIRTLSSEGNLDELNRFIDQYIEKMPDLSIRQFCKTPAVNALLNHYVEEAKNEKIHLSLDISIPEDSSIPETELCSILGNILENAINACKDIEERRRFIRLSVTAMNDYYLCIAAVNSFKGNPVVNNNGQYVSTGEGGSGIGLESITSVARSMKGSADFSHEGNEFFSNVMLPL